MSRETTLKVALLICLVVAVLYASLGRSSVQLHARPHSAPTPGPAVPALPSHAQKALAHMAQTAHISAEQLVLADQFGKELVLSDHSLSRNLVLDREGSGQLLYEVIVDTETGEVVDGREMEVLWEAEQTAYRTRYGGLALEYVARREGVAGGSLQLANDVLESYPLTGAVVWRVKVLDVAGETTYEVALNAEGKEVDAEALKKAEFEASRAKYGRLDSELYYRLQVLEPDEPVPVLMWVRGVNCEPGRGGWL